MGCAPSALRGVLQTLEATIVEMAAVWEQDGMATGEAREIIGAVDDPCLAQMILVCQDVRTGDIVQEEGPDKRTVATWHAWGGKRLRALGPQGLYLTRIIHESQTRSWDSLRDVLSPLRKGHSRF